MAGNNVTCDAMWLIHHGVAFRHNLQIPYATAMPSLRDCLLGLLATANVSF
jgi:hypothetical protein